MAGSYNAMRCALLDEQADLYIERVREFVDQVKDMITNPELPLLESEEALKRAFTVFNQTLKTEGDGDEDPRLAKEIPEKRMSDMVIMTIINIIIIIIAIILIMMIILVTCIRRRDRR
ncbi:hypothetical protein EGW08_005575 [Elysia chlorotica]|uniref:Uncharacterized protein n=1 Tax=Elysia chlorotica TaxID=188477 RepID=A0A433TYR4_ELYCH|nr:hypothetical protein EGW08_005575 [Elysia chlorotica]